MSTVKFISDLHLGHRNICKFRTRFKNVEEHDSYIKERILKNVNKRTTLYLLGDLAFTEEAGKWIVELSKICNVKIILGNHDTDNKLRMDNVRMWMAEGIDVYSLKRYKHVWLSHCPLNDQELRGKPNIHGHVHGNKIMNWSGTDIDKRYFDVSCESVDYTPISFEDICKQLVIPKK